MNEQLINILSKLLLTYGYIQFYIFKCYILAAKYLFDFYPEKLTPSINSAGQKITINNIQMDTIDVTKKGKIIIQKILWDKKINGFNLFDFMQYIGACSVVYIDYCIENNQTLKQKKINIADKKNPKYADKEGKLFDISFGQIIF